MTGRGSRRYLTPEDDQIDIARREYVAGRIEIEELERRIETALEGRQESPFEAFKTEWV